MLQPSPMPHLSQPQISPCSLLVQLLPKRWRQNAWMGSSRSKRKAGYQGSNKVRAQITEVTALKQNCQRLHRLPERLWCGLWFWTTLAEKVIDYNSRKTNPASRWDHRTYGSTRPIQSPGDKCRSTKNDVRETKWWFARVPQSFSRTYTHLKGRRRCCAVRLISLKFYILACCRGHSVRLCLLCHFAIRCNARNCKQCMSSYKLS